jgi:uncharacterized protein YjbI with pentapeptide repeats
MRPPQWFTTLVLVVVAVLALELAGLYGYLALNTYEQKKDFAAALATFWAATVLAFGIVFTALNLAATQRNVEAVERNVEVSREGQITERFTRAVEQFGSERLEIRLGGIYALERVARDSKPDHLPIMEMLTAFVRKECHWSRKQTPEADWDGVNWPPIRQDIQAVIDVIGRRKQEHEPDDVMLDLSHCDLRGARLSRAGLSRVNLRESNLARVEMLDVSMPGTDLTDAILIGASIMPGKFQDQPGYRRPNLNGAILRGARCRGAFIFHCDLVGAYLSGADLTDVDLGYADLTDARISAHQLKQTSTYQGAKLPADLPPDSRFQ